MILNGMPVWIDQEVKIQRRKHRKKRINKKWQKHYGFYIKPPLLKNGEAIMIDGVLHMNYCTYCKLLQQLQIEQMLGGKR